MPIKSAAFKALRQNQKARARNLTVKLHLKKLAVRLRKAVTAKQAAEVQSITKEFIRALDRAAQKKIIPRNTASRKKSRLMAAAKKNA